MLDESFLKKIEIFDQWVVPHDDFMRSLEGIQEAIQLTQYSRESVNCALLGDPGVGKTFFCEHVKRLMPEKDIVIGDQEITEIPVFYVEVPEYATPTTLVEEMLTKLGDPNPTGGNGITEKTTKLKKQMAIRRTKLVFMDEFHNLLDETRSKGQRKGTSAWLKRLINTTDVVYCPVGEPRFINHLEKEVERRIVRKYPLNRLSNIKKDEDSPLKGFYEALTVGIEELFDVKVMAKPSDEHFINQLNIATDGKPYFINMLYKDVLQDVYKAGKQTVTVQDFCHSFEKGLTSSVCTITKNPFTLTSDGLNNAVLKPKGRSK